MNNIKKGFWRGNLSFILIKDCRRLVCGLFVFLYNVLQTLDFPFIQIKTYDIISMNQ